MSLQNKRILLGITGGIAAYKTVELVRRLRAAGADVRVVMTRAAQAFITPLTLQTVAAHKVYDDLLDPETENRMSHIQLARWADLVLVAPASADFIACLAAGIANDLLTTLCLATTAPIAIAPAMNQQMWSNAATQANVQCLITRQISLFGPAEGEQACGETGLGRMLEPEQLIALVARQFEPGLLDGVQVVITAGPTREAIDPVRYIGNYSSGKMGFALAQAAIEIGAVVTLIAGPVSLATPQRVQRIDVTSAQQMHHAVLAQLGQCDIFIAAAAVADYRPAQYAEQKLKKSDTSLTIELVKNPDIVSAVTAHQLRPFTVGFAAETDQLKRHACDKLQRKKLDMIIANDVSQPTVGFDSDDNAVTLFTTTTEQHFSLRPKQQLARDLMAHIANGFTNRGPLCHSTAQMPTQ